MPDGEAPSSAPVADRRTARVRVELPGDGPGAIAVADAMGRPIAQERFELARSPGGAQLTLALRAGEVVLAELAPRP